MFLIFDVEFFGAEKLKVEMEDTKEGDDSSWKKGVALPFLWQHKRIARGSGKTESGNRTEFRTELLLRAVRRGRKRTEEGEGDKVEAPLHPA